MRIHQRTMMTKQPAPLTPRLRFPEFNNAGAWEEKRLGDICEVRNKERKPIPSSDRKKGIYPYYGASGIIDYINDYIFEQRLLLVGEDGAKWGAFEKTAFIADGRYWVNNHAHVLQATKVNDTLLENYLIKLDISPFVTGTAPPKLTLRKLQSIPILVPLLFNEQQKIADCLSALDDLIAAETQKLHLLEDHKKGLLQKLFPAEGEIIPRLRFPEFRRKGAWKSVNLGAVLESESSLLAQNKLLTSKNGYPVYGASGIAGYSTEYAQNKDYVAIIKDGSGIGKLFYCKKASSVLGTLSYLKAKNTADQCLVWLFYLLHNINFKKHIKGSGIPHIYFRDYAEEPVFIPSLSEQQKIADCLSSLDNLVVAETQKLHLLEDHKKGLLQGLFPEGTAHNG